MIHGGEFQFGLGVCLTNQVLIKVMTNLNIVDKQEKIAYGFLLWLFQLHKKDTVHIVVFDVGKGDAISLQYW